ncbi:hypothetical protein ACTIVE_4589 [Actinomadura verrucosospora]|uniref:Uncharacterized protein n=1 Tax=Actinomadura verrucosospora TaxID=46165 RepID=A0A7D4ANV4_ACTVE|nr:hypothetical protein ACTIVE_4589 [Actinomadura verrucosospora]
MAVLGVGAGDERGDVVDGVGEVGGLGAGLLEEGAVQAERGGRGEPRDVERRRDEQAVHEFGLPGGCGRRGAAGRLGAALPGAAGPRSIRPGCSASIVPNCSTMDSGVQCPVWTAPEPTRIRDVAAATASMRICGAALATPGARWCSASQ